MLIYYGMVLTGMAKVNFETLKAEQGIDLVPLAIFVGKSCIGMLQLVGNP